MNPFQEIPGYVPSCASLTSPAILLDQVPARTASLAVCAEFAPIISSYNVSKLVVATLQDQQRLANPICRAVFNLCSLGGYNNVNFQLVVESALQAAQVRLYTEINNHRDTQITTDMLVFWMKDEVNFAVRAWSTAILYYPGVAQQVTNPGQFDQKRAEALRYINQVRDNFSSLTRLPGYQLVNPQAVQLAQPGVVQLANYPQTQSAILANPAANTIARQPMGIDAGVVGLVQTSAPMARPEVTFGSTVPNVGIPTVGSTSQQPQPVVQKPSDFETLAAKDIARNAMQPAQPNQQPKTIQQAVEFLQQRSGQKVYYINDADQFRWRPDSDNSAITAWDPAKELIFIQVDASGKTTPIRAKSIPEVTMNVISHLNVPATKITPQRQTLKERDHLDRAMVALKHTSPGDESPSVIDYDESLVVKTPPWALLKTTSRLQEAAVVVARDVMLVELDHYDRPEGVAAFASLGDNLELTGLIDEINAYYRALSKKGTCAFTGFELEIINQLVAREISHYLSNMLCLNINVTSCISDKPATALFDYLSEAFPTHHEILVNNQSKIIDKVFSHIAKLADNQEMVKTVLGLLLDSQTCAQSLIDNDEPFVIRARSTSFVYIDLPFEKLNAALPPKQLGVPVVLADDACLLKTIMLNVTARSRETLYRCRTKDGVDFQVSINAIDEDSLLLRGL